jgi:hypothetical protein
MNLQDSQFLFNIEINSRNREILVTRNEVLTFLFIIFLLSEIFNYPLSSKFIILLFVINLRKSSYSINFQIYNWFCSIPFSHP